MSTLGAQYDKFADHVTRGQGATKAGQHKPAGEVHDTRGAHDGSYSPQQLTLSATPNQAAFHI